jgi:hypothetical protein
MYPFSTRTGGDNRSSSNDYLYKIVGRELGVASSIRVNMKDTTSSKLNIKTDKAADMLQHAEVKLLRQQINALPEELREMSRRNLHLEHDLRRRDLLDYQVATVCHLHKIIKKQLIAQGVDLSSFRIGGNDRRTYGKFNTLFVAG